MVTKGVWAMICSTGRSATAVPPAGTTVSPSDSGMPTLLQLMVKGGDPLEPPRAPIGWRSDRHTSRTGRGGQVGSERDTHHRVADRPLRTDHAAGGPALGQRIPALRL